MTSCVLEGSVAAKWYLHDAGETLAAETLRLPREHAASRMREFAPDLLWPELGNIFWLTGRFPVRWLGGAF